MLRSPVRWLADRDPIPTPARAVVGYYARTGVFDPRSLWLKRRVDAAVDAMTDATFDAVEAAIAARLDREAVELTYDTKLLLPAKLTLGYLYRRIDKTQRDRAEALTALVVEALLDGDMRDAITDDEYEDFLLTFPDDEDPTEADRRAAAEIAQSVLEDRVERGLAEYPPGVRAAYDRTVAVSERHQRQDARFRALMAVATGEASPTAVEDQDQTENQEQDQDSELDLESGLSSPEHARERIAGEYRHGVFDEQPGLFEPSQRELPYFKTQYDRVGVIYHGMIDMYRAAGFTIGDPFQRSIVLAIVGAQVWLDDVDDYQADVAAGQLTPVTAEYLLAETDRQGKQRVRAISESYLRQARQQATVADSTLTGIATEYIYRSGDLSVLPG